MRSDIFTGTIFFLLSSFMYYTACQLPPGMFGTLGAGFFPKIIFGTLSILSLILTIKSIIALLADKKSSAENESFSLRQYSTVLIAFVLFFFFVLALKYFGFVIASLFFMPTLMWILGPKTKQSLLLILCTSVGMTAVIYLSFTHVLQVFLPTGILF